VVEDPAGGCASPASTSVAAAAGAAVGVEDRRTWRSAARSSAAFGSGGGQQQYVRGREGSRRGQNPPARGEQSAGWSRSRA
jgi:hypothetical protein